MATNIRSVSPSSETHSEGVYVGNKLEKALISKTPPRQTDSGKKFSDMNSNDVSEPVDIENTMLWWIYAILISTLVIGNLILIFLVYSILRLGNGMESLELLPNESAIKFTRPTNLDHVYKRNGLIEGFLDVPMGIQTAEEGVVVSVQSRLSRTNTEMILNSTGMYIRGVNSLELVIPDTSETAFSTSAADLNIPDPVNNINAKAISTKRISSPVDEDLNIRSDRSAYLRGAEGTHLESKQINWTADQDINMSSINGTIILDAKDGVFVDVKYLPIAKSENKSDVNWAAHATGHFKVCVCMPQGKLFKIPVPDGKKVSCSDVNTSPELNPCA